MYIYIWHRAHQITINRRKIEVKEEKHSYVQGRKRSELSNKWLNTINHRIQQEHIRAYVWLQPRVQTLMDD